MARCVGSCAAAICPELDEKRKCFAERVKEAATTAAAPAAWRCWPGFVLGREGALSQWTKKNPTPHRNEVIGHVPVKIYKNP